MEDKKSAAILLGLLDKYPLTDEEKDAVKNAVGILGWTALAGSRIKSLKDKRERDAKWNRE
jgi:hypothetical protein